jgi:hypothetical protein
VVASAVAEPEAAADASTVEDVHRAETWARAHAAAAIKAIGANR